MSTSASRTLSIPRATALYIGALLGPGLLLLPGLAAEQAGPASIIAWIALLGLSAAFAAVFAALGRATPNAAGAAGYAAAGLGHRAAAVTRWWFLAGVVAGAPIVCLIGASYVTAVTGGGPLLRAAVAATLLIAVLGLALGGVRASAVAQLLLVALLIAVVVTAVVGSAPAARPANWTPFAPHGWFSIGRAAATLMLSFVGWEAVAPLTARLRAGQLTRVIGIAFTVTTLLYLGLAVATVSCLGHGSDLSVPLADLLQLAVGTAGRAVAAVAALVLTAGAVNAYLSGATEMVRELTAVSGRMGPNGRRHLPPFSPRAFLGVVAVTGLTLIGLSALRLTDTAVLVSVPTTMFVAVYLSCMASAARILSGRVRVVAAVALLAVAVVLAFSGWMALLAAAVIAALAAGTGSRKRPATHPREQHRRADPARHRGPGRHAAALALLALRVQAGHLRRDVPAGLEVFLDDARSNVGRLPAEPRARLIAMAEHDFDFAVADLPRHQLMDVNVVPNFQPSAEAYAPAVEVYGVMLGQLRGVGVTTDEDAGLYTALIGGLVNQQLANDPGGQRWRRLIPRGDVHVRRRPGPALDTERRR